ncbi:MAG: cysteine dioxygenase family protein [Flavobacteriales bacterium]|nr:cysteine dioxygenase family protein [Flavobacteriales bacterium]MBK9288889.1 cysteine dioxygenase family protein [Flavobacteriales bacterium]
MISSREGNTMTRARTIRSLEQLIAELDQGPGPDGYGLAMRSLAIGAKDLQSFATWNAKHYTRNCIAQREGYELLLICYEAGQRTSIHDHDSLLAHVVLLSGTLLEERFTTATGGGLLLVSSTEPALGTVSAFDKAHSIHRYSNVGPGRSMTLNLYAPPLLKWRVYDERSGRPVVKPIGS